MFIYKYFMPRVKTISDDEVLDRALAVLLERGPHRFTLPDVSRAVGLSPSTLIQRFGSKRGLMDAVLARSTTVLNAELEAREPTGDPRQDLIAWLTGIARPLRTHAHLAGHLTLLIEDITVPSRRASAQEHMRVLRSGIASRLVDMGSPTPEAHADMIEAHWNGLGIQWAMRDTGEDIEAWVSRGLSTLLERLLPPDDHPY